MSAPARTILGIDSSTAASSACLLRADGASFEVVPAAERLGEPPAHARELLPAVARVLGEAGVGFAQLDALAVGRGPGGFTGLRIGLASAHGLAKAHALPLHGVSSLAALAAGLPADRPRLALIDARRGELFAALYDGAETVLAPFAAPPDQVVARVRASGLDPLAAGDGSLRFRDQLEAAGIEVAAEVLHVVRALHVCRLAAQTPGSPPEAVLPDYVRAPDAVPR